MKIITNFFPCSSCKGPFSLPLNAVVTSCGHIFHRACLTTSSCPKCMQSYRLLGRTIHVPKKTFPDHECSICLLTLIPNMQENGRTHMSCYKCSKCSEPVKNKGVQHQGQYFHPHCFQTRPSTSSFSYSRSLSSFAFLASIAYIAYNILFSTLSWKVLIIAGLVNIISLSLLK